MNAKNEVTKASPSAEDAAKAALLVLYTVPVQAIGKAAQKIETARGGLWKSGILAGLTIAHANGHDAETYHMGMALAAEDQDIPRGSWSSYLATAKNLLTDIHAGKISLEAVQNISIQDARKRYAKPKASKKEAGEGEPAETIEANTESSARNALLSALNRAVVKLNDSQLADLVMLAESQVAENEPVETEEEVNTGQPMAQAA